MGPKRLAEPYFRRRSIGFMIQQAHVTLPGCCLCSIKETLKSFFFALFEHLCVTLGQSPKFDAGVTASMPQSSFESSLHAEFRLFQG